MSFAEIVKEREQLLQGIKALQIAFLIEIIFGIIAVPYSIFKLFTFFYLGHIQHIVIQWRPYFIINSIISITGGIIIFYFLYKGFEKVKDRISGTSIGIWGAILYFNSHYSLIYSISFFNVLHSPFYGRY